MTSLAIELSPVEGAQRTTLEQLMQLYLHDFSEFAPIASDFGDVDADGRFSYPYLQTYFTEAMRVALLVRADGKTAGFVLLNAVSLTGHPVDHAVAEFFVMRKFRRIGIGSRIVRGLVSERRGTWEIAIAAYNAPAQAFWRRATHALDGYVSSEHQTDAAIWSGPIIRLDPIH